MISVIVPVYQIEKYLPNCIESILAQTYPDFEVILVDDGSTDRSGNICDEYAAKDRRVKVIHKINAGVSAARNSGIDASNGNYISFIDGDDWIEPDFFSLLVSNLEKYSTDISHCGYTLDLKSKSIPMHGTASIKVYENIEGLQEFILGRKIEPGLWNKLYKRKLFDNLRLDESLKINEDFLLNYYLFKISNSTVFHDVCKYHYQKREGSASTSALSEYSFQLIEVSERIIKDATGNKDILPFCEVKMVASCFSLLNDIIVQGKYTHRAPFLLRTINSHGRKILTNSIYHPRYKIGLILLKTCPALYHFLVKKKNS
ncbi:MAG: hypothetical protein C0410_08460 [Anaerolinea sp.]|nr:hypothetical protein [Anaerolinea sp.]